MKCAFSKFFQVISITVIKNSNFLSLSHASNSSLEYDAQTFNKFLVGCPLNTREVFLLRMKSEKIKLKWIRRSRVS